MPALCRRSSAKGDMVEDASARSTKPMWVPKLCRLKYMNARGRAELTRLMFAATDGRRSVAFEEIRWPITIEFYLDENGEVDKTRWPNIIQEEFLAAKASGELDASMGQVPLLEVRWRARCNYRSSADATG